MNRLTLTPADRVQQTVNGLYEDISRRVKNAPQGNCPVELTAAFLRLSLAQSCGKCVPCRIGLDVLSDKIEAILNGSGSREDLSLIEQTAYAIYDSADCAIGFEAAKLVLNGLAFFRDDYISHMENHRCTSSFNSVPCTWNCPAHVDIPGYIALIRSGNCKDAVRLIRQDNPFPSVCGLICEHPCESHCRRGIVDDSINIRGLKRYAVDHAGEVPIPRCAPPTGKTVAIVGGGPSGLTAAYFLRLMGHSVTIFEKYKTLGGMLRYGIPSYRLPARYLDADINAILSTGIQVCTETNVGTDITISELREKFDAIYIAIGAHNDRKLGVEGENSRGVISAVELLHSIGDGSKPDFTGKNVVIVGGGNVAMDAARTSIRLGADKVTCVYRRRREDMTALDEEIEGTLTEGCALTQLMAPIGIQHDDEDNVTGLIVQPQIIGEYSRGRPAPRNADKPSEVIPCDIIVVAIGQAVDSAHFAANGMPTNHELIWAGGTTAIKSMPGVFAGGDCVFGPATVIRSIESGKVASANIDSYLGTHVDISANVDIPSASFYFQTACGRANTTERPAEERKNDFDLIERGLSDEEAMQECSRCLRCDHYGFGAVKGGRHKKW